MDPRQTRRWLIVTVGAELTPTALRRIGRDTGIWYIGDGADARTRAQTIRRLRRLAHARGMAFVWSPRGIARVHDRRELRRALLARTPMVALSPIFATRSHPGWAPIPRMRAAAFARLARRRLVALGGMDARRYARVTALGFIGWAGIRAFRT